MKIPTPVITLIVGAVLAVSLLIASMITGSPKKATASASVGATATVPTASPVQSTGAQSTGAQPTGAGATATSAKPESASPSASPSHSPSRGFVVPPHANYVGKVADNEGSVAIVVHDTFAIAYFCNGSTQEAWLKGTPHDGKLSMTGNDHASLTVNYALGHARGTVTVDGISHEFSIIAVHRPSGLFQSIAVVRGATIKVGWIVLANGTQVGSMEPNENAVNPLSQAAPKLDVSSLTAQYEGTTIVATPIDAETGSGF